MMANLPLARGNDIFDDAIDAELEIGAYELLWVTANARFKR